MTIEEAIRILEKQSLVETTHEQHCIANRDYCRVLGDPDGTEEWTRRAKVFARVAEALATALVHLKG